MPVPALFRHAHRPRRLLALGLGPLVAVGMQTAPGLVQASAAPNGPDFEMPFPCGQTWTGSSRPYHSPSSRAVDWNRADDFGSLVVATAPGVVTSVTDLGSRSYGRYVVVDHGDGRSSLYAHLSAFWSTPGQAVDQGTPIGLLGSTGGSTGPHLHFEERTNRVDQDAYFHREAFRMGSTQASRSCGDTPVIGDWDGNGTANVGVLRRSAAPVFRLKRPGRTMLRIPFGAPADQPVSGDWDGDGHLEVGVRRPGAMSFLLRSADGTVRTVRMGLLSDVGLTGDWNGDGRTDLGTWHPRTRLFTLRAASGRVSTVTLGALGDKPVAGDWNGDGRTDLGVFDPGTSTFSLRTVSRAGAVTLTRVPWGSPTSIPVAGDWNHDGVGDVGAWEPATAVFSLRLSPVRGNAAAGAGTRTVPYGVPRR